jgi:hypothetical protein
MTAVHQLIDVKPVGGRGRRGFVVNCSCGWTSRPIAAAGMSDNVHERHKADPDVAGQYH